jgi:molybdate transport system permease protein
VSWDPLLLSLELATIAMIVALVVGTALAVLLTWRKLPGRDAIAAFVMSPLVLPPTVLGYYLFTALIPFGQTFVFNFRGAVIAATVGSLPLVVRSVLLGLDSVDPTLVSAARTLGARPPRVLFTVRLPLAGPGLFAGGMLGFARALGDYGMTQVVAGARIDGWGMTNTSPASIFIYDQFIGGHEDTARAMSLVMMVVGVTIMFFALRLERRLIHHRG